MASAGAPPPPPPPPRKTLNDLPTEMLLNVIQYLKPGEYVAFALAVWPVLERHGLVPPLTEDMYRQITNECLWRERMHPGKLGHDFIWHLPRELTDEIIQYLEPADLIALLFTHKRQFFDYIPLLTEATKRFMRNAKKK